MRSYPVTLVQIAIHTWYIIQIVRMDLERKTSIHRGGLKSV